MVKGDGCRGRSTQARGDPGTIKCRGKIPEAREVLIMEAEGLIDGESLQGMGGS